MCYILDNKFLVTGRAKTGVGSTQPGVVAIWYWENGLLESPTETVLNRKDKTIKIRHCYPLFSVFLKHASVGSDFMMFYSVWENKFQSIDYVGNSHDTINVM